MAGRIDLKWKVGWTLLTWHGVVTTADTVAMSAKLDVEGEYSPYLYDRLHDLRDCERLDFDFNTVMHLGAQRKAQVDRRADAPLVRVAFVAVTPGQYGMVRMYQQLMTGSKIEVRIFEELDAAVGWMRTLDEQADAAAGLAAD